MPAITFKPWVGRNYKRSRSLAPWQRRVLVLGESIYEYDGMDKSADFPSVFIEEQIVGDDSRAFWTKIVTAFLGEKPSLEEKAEFWHFVAFHEYVQRIVGFGPKTRPTEQDWRNGEEGFRQVLDELQPDLVVFLGNALWENGPSGPAGPTLRALEDAGTVIFNYRGGRRKCLAICLKHPSSFGFNPLVWHPLIQEALELDPSSYKASRFHHAIAR